MHLLKCFLNQINPRLLVSFQYFYHFHKFINWEKPQDINEKINWLKFYSDTSLWTHCADKYRVREYVRLHGLEDILVKLYGKWNSIEDIEWNLLPERFVLKTNNGSGDILVCQNKAELDIKSISRKYAKLLEKSFSGINGEPHYAAMKPCLIVEELLDCKEQPIRTDTLIDYKIWCFNGVPHHIWACFNRHNDTVEVATYDLNWVRHDECSVFTNHYIQAKKNLPKPKTLNRMLEVASILSEKIPQVRVDLYEVNEKVYFGEMTFSSAGGFMNFYTPEFLLEMGSRVTLPSKR